MIIIVINIKKSKESQVSVLLRIMTNYLQLVTTSLSFSTNYPKTIEDIFAAFKQVGGASNTFLSFDCFITDYEIKYPFPSNMFLKVFLAALLPIILTVLVF